jgi:hypothetical protein
MFKFSKGMHMLSFLKKIPLIFVAVTLSASSDFFNPTTTPGGTPNLSVSGENAESPQIATDATGEHVYATWRRSDGTDYLIQVTRSLNYGVDFSDPSSTPTGTTPPNLSVGGQSAGQPQITTDATGQYVYAVWARSDGSNLRIQVARSNNEGAGFSDPSLTPGGTPNLSVSGEPANFSQITTNGTGQYVYATWTRSDGTNGIIQVARSTDFGDKFYDPTSTPTGSTPNLSVSGENATVAQITTDATGEHVYGIWQRFDGTNWIIQVARSTDFGDKFYDPNSTPTGSTPNLSVSGENAFAPQIATDDTGQYVYTIWRRSDGTNFIVQVAISENEGDDFSNPLSTPTGSTPNLSVSGEDADAPQIATNATGEYVYAIWLRHDGTKSRVQVARSENYGEDFEDPTSTPTGSTPNLSVSGENAFNPQITTDGTGKYVYATWIIEDGTDKIVQVAVSSDFGVTFSDPTTTPTGTTPPNLSVSGGNALLPQITTDATGKYAYAVWTRSDGTNFIIQVAVAITSAADLNPSFNKYLTRFLLQNDNVVELFWDEIVEAKSYKVYFNSLSNPIYNGVENKFFHHGVNVKDVKTYYLTWIDENDVESTPVEIVVQ